MGSVVEAKRICCKELSIVDIENGSAFAIVYALVGFYTMKLVGKYITKRCCFCDCREWDYGRLLRICGGNLRIYRLHNSDMYLLLDISNNDTKFGVEITPNLVLKSHQIWCFGVIIVLSTPTITLNFTPKVILYII